MNIPCFHSSMVASTILPLPIMLLEDGVVFLNLNFQLFVVSIHINTADFCVLTLYSPTLLNIRVLVAFFVISIGFYA